MRSTPQRRKRGMIGIEAAIVMIAFVIVGAALAFVALNMGLFATQKTKEVITRGLGEASSALEIDGSVTAYTSDGSSVTIVSFPIKVAPGRQAVDLNVDKTIIRAVLARNAYENLYEAVLYLNESDRKLYWPNGTSATLSGVASLRIDELAEAAFSITGVETPGAVTIIMKNVNEDGVLEYGEKAVVIVKMDSSNALKPYDKIIIEVRPPEGAPLTVERTIPATLPSSGGTVELY
uniref:Flagellin n=1 Tax=Fervidicoccus fontis TaxID=683846 RepID=A0A7J3ZLR7_9CREN